MASERAQLARVMHPDLGMRATTSPGDGEEGGGFWLGGGGEQQRAREVRFARGRGRRTDFEFAKRADTNPGDGSDGGGVHDRTELHSLLVPPEPAGSQPRLSERWDVSGRVSRKPREASDADANGDEREYEP